MNDTTLINHEKIHLKQQQELLVIPFYIWYGVEYVIRLVQFTTHDRAYRNISFEKEAYTHEMDFTYLKKRKYWSFLKYL
tara:strand:- start:3467 stop:3703 length:237 start_codon:yes stop_codon:yes gene_type:complete